jgi:hypothetical protein
VKKKPIKSIYVIVNDEGEPLDGWYASPRRAWSTVKEDTIEENCGPVRVLRFAAQEESPAILTPPNPLDAGPGGDRCCRDAEGAFPMSEGLISEHSRARLRDVDWNNWQSRMCVADLVRRLLGNGDSAREVADDIVRALPKKQRILDAPFVLAFVESIAAEGYLV